MSVSDDITEGRVCGLCHLRLAETTGHYTVCTACGGDAELTGETGGDFDELLCDEGKMFQYAQELGITCGLNVLCHTPWHYQLRDKDTNTIIDFWPTKLNVRVGTQSTIKGLNSRFDTICDEDVPTLLSLVQLLVQLKTDHVKHHESKTEDIDSVQDSSMAGDDTSPF